MKIECGPNADQDGSGQALSHPGHPNLLLRGTKANPHDVCARIVDVRRDLVVAQVIDASDWRTQRAYDTYPVKSLGHLRSNLCRDSIVATVEEVAPTPRCRG